MAKKIKFPLIMKNDVIVKNLDELRENFDLGRVVGYFLDGRLFRWLEARYYDTEAEAIQNLNKDSADFNKRLCSIFGVQYEEVYNSQADIQAIEERNAKFAKLKQYTSNPVILNNIDSVAFDQEDLADLLDEDVHEIYLCNNSFVIPLRVENKRYVGIGKTEVIINSDSEVDFASKRIEFENVQFNEDYRKIIEKPLVTDTAKSLIEKGNLAKGRHDYETAMDYYLQAANYGNGEAMDRIAELYNNGLGVPKDDSIAYQWYKKSAEAGFPEGMEDFAFACHYGFSGNNEDGLALEWFKRAGNAGRFDAYFQAGKFYLHGIGTEVNYTEAKKYYELAAKHDVASAFHQLAWLYEHAMGVPYDRNKAMEYYKIAADKGISESQFALGVIFFAERNIAEAAAYFNEAAKQNHKEAYNSLGVIKEQNYSDFLTAKKYYESAANLGSVNGMYNVARMYERDENYPQALDWYKKAANSNDSSWHWTISDAIYSLGRFYNNGLGVPRDGSLAQAYYKQAADMGHETAKEAYLRLQRELNYLNFDNEYVYWYQMELAYVIPS